MSPYEAAKAAIAADNASKQDAIQKSNTGSLCVSNTQRRIHIASESAAVFIGIPFLLWLAFKPNREIQPWEKAGLVGFAASTLIVDGGLLLSWLSKSRKADKTKA